MILLTTARLNPVQDNPTLSVILIDTNTKLAVPKFNIRITSPLLSTSFSLV